MSDNGEVHLTTLQEERTTGVRLYRPHSEHSRAKSTFDWDAITPACTSCGQKSGQLDDHAICPACRAPEEPPAHAPTPRLAPRPKPAPKKRTTKPKPPRPARPRRRAPRKTPTPVDVPALVEAYRNGQTIVQLSDALHVGRQRIRDVLAGAGVEVRRGPRPTERPPRPPAAPLGKPVDEAAIAAEYAAGDSAPTVAIRHGIRPKRVRAIVERRGGELRDDRATHSGGQPREYHSETCAAVERLYVVEELSRAEVAERLGLSYKTVVTIMQRRGVRARQGQAGGVDGAANLKEQIRALGVETREIKAWAFREGLVERISRGLPSKAVVDAYEVAHGGDE